MIAVCVVSNTVKSRMKTVSSKASTLTTSVESATESVTKIEVITSTEAEDESSYDTTTSLSMEPSILNNTEVCH